jgi:hypothetical protein
LKPLAEQEHVDVQFHLMAMYSIELDVLFKTTKLALSGLS